MKCACTLGSRAPATFSESAELSCACPSFRREKFTEPTRYAIEFQCNFVLRPSKVRKLVCTNQFQVKSTKMGTVRKYELYSKSFGFFSEVVDSPAPGERVKHFKDWERKHIPDFYASHQFAKERRRTPRILWFALNFERGFSAAGEKLHPGVCAGDSFFMQFFSGGRNSVFKVRCKRQYTTQLRRRPARRWRHTHWQ